jgi:hypothetical protein
MFAFFAALNVLDAKVLYSNQKVRDLMDPSVKANRANLERHHLFPVNFLKAQGVDDKRDYNQIANYTMIEWGDNSAVSDRPPSEYVPIMEARPASSDIEEAYRHHALPPGWQTLGYEEFLKRRRVLMAATIRDAYELLAGKNRPKSRGPTVAELIAAGEGDAIEFKSTLRTNLHTREKDPKIELMVLKTIAGLLNSRGGSLVVGVADDGAAVGLDADGFPNEDKLSLHLVNLLKDRIGGEHAVSIHPRFDDFDGVRVLVVDCEPSRAPVWVTDGTAERFFVRYGPSTQELVGAEANDYIRQRFTQP